MWHCISHWLYWPPKYCCPVKVAFPVTCICSLSVREKKWNWIYILWIKGILLHVLPSFPLLTRSPTYIFYSTLPLMGEICKILIWATDWPILHFFTLQLTFFGLSNDSFLVLLLFLDEWSEAVFYFYALYCKNCAMMLLNRHHFYKTTLGKAKKRSY